MMLTVVRNTKSPVKFWFLKNYLSPSFKEFIPFMAAEYGFDFELVQYQWPRWLHAQTEKQRIIWGYKILFLDVLFPLSVKKIIFVDADQVFLPLIIWVNVILCLSVDTWLVWILQSTLELTRLVTPPFVNSLCIVGTVPRDL